MNLTVIAGSNSTDLAKKIASELKSQYLKAEHRTFPDGERKITLSGKLGKKIIVVHSTHPPVDSNLVELLCLLSKAKKHTSQVYAVIPYLGYARQDKEFLPGEVVTSSVVADLLKGIGVSKLILVDIHSELILDYFKIPAVNLSAIPPLTTFVRRMKLQDPIVVSPDLYWSAKAHLFATLLGLQSFAINKKRNRKTGNLSISQSKIMSVKGRDVILLDDMISTGQSMALAAKHLKKMKCHRIIAVCTHALLVDDAEKRMKKAGISRIISTNTVPQKTSRVDVSNLIVNHIKNVI